MQWLWNGVVLFYNGHFLYNFLGHNCFGMCLEYLLLWCLCFGSEWLFGKICCRSFIQLVYDIHVTLLICFIRLFSATICFLYVCLDLYVFYILGWSLGCKKFDVRSVYVFYILGWSFRCKKFDVRSVWHWVLKVVYWLVISVFSNGEYVVSRSSYGETGFWVSYWCNGPNYLFKSTCNKTD